MNHLVIHKYINIKAANSKPLPYTSPTIHKIMPPTKRNGVKGTSGINIISPNIAISKKMGNVTN